MSIVIILVTCSIVNLYKKVCSIWKKTQTASQVYITCEVE